MNKLTSKNHLLSTMMQVGGLAMAAMLSGCGSDAPATVKPVPIAVEQPAPTTESYSMLKQQGTMWVNQQGQKVSLRGINLGNWLAMEMWMFGGEEALGGGILDQCTLENTLVERFGEAEKQRLMTLHRDSWITENDWDVMQQAGFNLVRVPFLYDLLENDDQPMTLKDDAWKYLDWAVEMAAARDMYLVLDLHGAAGRQGSEQHTGCAGQNQLWESDEYKARTAWLWKQIAARYKDEPAIAGYGLLNEPWGTDAETLKDFVVDLYDAVRSEDEQHIVILPGHNSEGITAYGDPLDYGMDNVAFEMHFYPGIFGWGEIGYDVHRDWLTCGENGDAGVCSWAKQARDVFTPMLIGEMQPWTGLGELGGDVTRATFDKYNQLNWAVTAWSLKTVSPAGGVGNGSWGLLTNNGDQLLAKAETWSCNNWESTFAEACAVSAKSTVPYYGEGSKTMYLAIKTGSFNGTDVIYDNIALTNDTTGENALSNGDFGTGEGWTEVAVWGDPRNYDFAYPAGEFAGSDTGAALNVTAPAGHNSVIYMPVQVEGGQSYTLSGKFKDNGDFGNDMWAEIYLIPEMPTEGIDVTGRVLPSVDANSSSPEEIAHFFTSFASMDYVANQDVMQALTATEPANIFVNIPVSPSNLSLNVSETSVGLSWEAIQNNISGYKIYRSTAPRSGFEVLAETTSTSYTDSELLANTTYYYYVSAYNETDEGYASNIEASGDTFYTLPTFIEAENYTASHPGVNTEGSGDIGGGFNIGSFETNRWVDYGINVETAGTYSAEFRLASLVGDVRFDVIVAGEVLTTITVPNTGGWQDYVTLSVNLDMPAGQSTLRLNSLDNQWNLNWMRFSEGAAEPTPEPEPTPIPTGDVDFVVTLQNPTGGTNANVTMVDDADKSAQVISLEVLASDGVDQGYASIPLESFDLSVFARLTFDMRDTQGVNTAHVTLVDDQGNTWSKWTDDQTTQDAWANLGLDYSEAASTIELSKVTEVRIAQWNSGTYLVSDVTLVAQVATPSPLPTGEVDYVFALPQQPTGGTNATVSVVNDQDKGADVLSLQVLANDGVDQGYASLSFAEIDFTQFANMTVQFKDSVGSNTAHVTLVDNEGATWSLWTDDSTSLNQWVTLNVNYQAAQGIDLSKVVEVRFAQWNAGTYMLDKVTLVASVEGSMSIPLSENPMSGSNATVSLVNDAEKAADVLSLEVLANDGVDQGYAGVSFAAIDMTMYQSLNFDMKDTQGNNTVYMTFVDGEGATWSAWTEAGTTQNEWATIPFTYSGAAGIDLTNIVEIRFAQWNAGTYYIANIMLN
ncbi:cellulase family glycosylhydrolase [Paraglaciecola aquimarina]|uniref:Exo-1,3-beta-glucanase D n=1 Tax=Paraglaciecola algarum TaxID=3050085 RepID=A0ABS9D8A0_9ALTE|nr:cellulase family glycosylhydrolase [Paraglaciecola sp. G1-23]MCF2949168.1 cellulase family glycosylhydrolase [Paraglaciecola sp. G1-23]